MTTHFRLIDFPLFLFAHRFILQDLDELHLFVAPEVVHQLQSKIDELMEKNSYNPLEAELAQKSK